MKPAPDSSGAGADPKLCRALLSRLEATLAGRQLRFMEVCGTHTVAIFQSGLASLLPSNVCHISGPGCPVCVTHEAEIALLLTVAQMDNIRLATFGDLMRVPGPEGLSIRQIPGARADVVYSPLDCLELARRYPGQEVVFAAVGFETTAPAVAAAIIKARELGIGNFSVVSLHKLVSPALKSLLSSGEAEIDGFLLPGHVATVIGTRAFDFIAHDFGKPAIVSGFEPSDLLYALNLLASQSAGAQAVIMNAYRRAVADAGNLRARELMCRVFEPESVKWRGLGEIADSGLRVREEYSAYDAKKKLALELPKIPDQNHCLCGAILKGIARPDQCPNFGGKCQPAHPIGPCMVSTEGSCAAWYKYGGNRL